MWLSSGNAKGNTDLKGAVIDSSAPAEKNQLTTGTLTWEDTGNKADYKASGEGISYAGKDAKLNDRGLTPSIAPTVKGNADSTTKSAVAKGTITITNTKDQKQNVSELNRDTKNSLNKLKEIFDKDKVQEKQEFIGLLSKDLNEAIHKVADKNNWADGSKEKAALHAIVSGMLSEMSGAGFSSGAFAGGVNEYVIGYLSRTKGDKWIWEHPDEVQWLSMALGGIVNKATGEEISIGEAMALAGTKWNKYQRIPEIREQIEKALKDGELNQLRENEYLVKYGKDENGNIVGVAINKHGYSYDVLISENDIQSDRFILKDKVHMNSYKEYDIYPLTKYEYAKDPNEQEYTGNPTTYRIGEFDGIAGSKGFYDTHYFRDAAHSTLENIAYSKLNFPVDMLEQMGYGGKGLVLFNKMGGVTAPFTAIEFYNDYQTYSGDRLWSAWKTDFYPILFSAKGAVEAGKAYGLPGMFAGGFVGNAVGTVMKNIEKGTIPTDQQIKDRKEKEEGNRNEK